MSIRSKLLVLVVAVTLVPAAAVGLTGYSLSQKALEHKIRGEFDDRTELLRERFSAKLTELTKNAAAWVSAPVMADVRLADADMRIASFLMNTKKSYPIIKDLSVVDAKKKMIATTSADFLDDKAAATAVERFNMSAALKGDEVSAISGGAGDSFVLLPIKDLVTKDGSVVGALLIEIDRKNLDLIVTEANAGKDVADKANVYLSSNGREIASLNEPAIDVSFTSLLATGYLFANEFLEIQSPQGVYVTKSVNIESALAGMRSPLTLTVLQPAEVAYSAVRTLAKLVFVITGALAGVFIMIGSGFARTLSRPITTLQTVAEDIIASRDLSKRVTITGSDETAALGQAFNSLLSEVEASQGKLEEYSQGLEVKVGERTKAIRTILDHVSFGLFICGADLVVNEGYSNSCKEIFANGVDLAGKGLCDLLQMDGRATDHFKSLYAPIFDPNFFLGDLAIDQLPTRFVLGSRSVGVTGSIIHDDAEEATGVLFCVIDITNLVKAEEEIERNRSLIKMLGNRDSFRAFLSDAKVRFEQIYAYLGAPIPDEANARLELHTLKGNFAVFGLAKAASSVHHVEDLPIITRQAVEASERVLQEFVDEYRGILGVSYGETTDESFVIPATLVSQTEARAEKAESDLDLKRVLCDFFRLIRLKRARTVLGPIEDAFGQLAYRVGKAARLEFVGADVLIPAEAAPVLRALPHLIRNALDHGVEPADQRGTKAEVATVRLSISVTDQVTTIVVADDGRGIDAEALRLRAAAKGLLPLARLKALPDHEIYKLIFESGISTASAVTEVSGRGVGMGAVKTAAEDIGGSIRIESRLGIGTTFTIELPRAWVGHGSMTNRPRALASA